MTMSRLKTAAWLSGLIYDDWPVVHSKLREQGMEMIGEPFDHKGSQAMLVLGHGKAWVVFRGTEATNLDFKDIFSNVGFPRSWNGPGEIHSGYRRHFHRISGPVRAFAEKIPSPIPLYVTGHSMGGALATVYAAWINSGKETDHKLAGLISFGSPKALNKEGADAITCEVTRVINKYDFAPHWPFIPGLTHPQGKLSINSGGWPGPVSRHMVPRYIRSVK